MDKQDLKNFINKILQKGGYPPVKHFAREFSDGIMYQLIFNLLFDSHIDC